MTDVDESMQEALALLHSSPDERPEVRANRFYERSKHLTLVGSGSSIELERTLRDVLKALSFSPDNPTYYMFLAKIYKNALDITSAMFCYRYVLRLQSGNYQAKRFLTELLVIKGKELMTTAARTESSLKFRSARACFDEALELDRENGSLWILKAICHVQLGENLEAYECINKIIRGGKGITAEMYVLRAKIQWARGLTEQGNNDIKQAGRLDPDHPEVLSYTARSYSKAEKLYKESVHDFSQGKYKEALQSIDYAIHITTNDIKLLIMQAKIYRKLNELQKAYDSMLKAKAICEKAKKNSDFPVMIPSDITIQINLILNDMAINYALNRDYTNAILLLNKIIKTEKEISKSGLLQVNNKYYINRGDCYRAISRYHDAITDYEFALSLDKSNWNILTRLSLSHYLISVDIFNDESDFYNVIVHLDKAIGYNSKVAEYYVVRGKAHYYISNFNAAHNDFKKALELDNTKEEIRERLAQFDDLMDTNTHKKKKSTKMNDNFVTASVTLSDIQALQPKTTEISNTINNNAVASPERKHTTGKSLAATTAAKNNSNDSAVTGNNKRLYEDKVIAVRPKEEDVVDMMLRPKQASKLPNLRMLSRSADNGLGTKEYLIHDRNVKKMFRNRNSNDSSSKRAGESISQDTEPHAPHKKEYIPDYMKEIDIYRDLPEHKKASAFRNAWKASNQVSQKHSKVTQLLENRIDTSRGSLWGMMDTAKQLAYETSHPKHRRKNMEDGISKTARSQYTPRKPSSQPSKRR